MNHAEAPTWQTLHDLATVDRMYNIITYCIYIHTHNPELAIPSAFIRPLLTHYIVLLHTRLYAIQICVVVGGQEFTATLLQRL